MLDLPPDIETMRTLVRRLTNETDAIKVEMRATRTSIDELRAEIVKLKAQQIARGHDPD